MSLKLCAVLALFFTINACTIVGVCQETSKRVIRLEYAPRQEPELSKAIDQLIDNAAQNYNLEDLTAITSALKLNFDATAFESDASSVRQEFVDSAKALIAKSDHDSRFKVLHAFHQVQAIRQQRVIAKLEVIAAELESVMGEYPDVPHTRHIPAALSELNILPVFSFSIAASK